MKYLDFDKAIEALEYIREHEKAERPEIKEKFGNSGEFAYTELVQKRREIKELYGLKEFRKTRLNTIDNLIKEYKNGVSPMKELQEIKAKNRRKDKKIERIITTVLIVIFILGFLALRNCGSSSYDYKKIDKGYTTDPDYSPTFHKDGQYHNNGTGDRQIQYQGSREQKNDLDAIDRYSREHPDF